MFSAAHAIAELVAHGARERPAESARRPRRAASTRFSAIDIDGAVPLNGFWNTRPMSDARRCSGQRRDVRARPAESSPRSTKNPPATALSSVDFPDPFVPMTMTNEPSSTVRSTPRSARTSFGVPALKVLKTLRSSSTATSPGLPRSSCVSIAARATAARAR